MEDVDALVSKEALDDAKAEDNTDEVEEYDGPLHIEENEWLLLPGPPLG